MKKSWQVSFPDIQSGIQEELIARLSVKDYHGFEQTETELRAFIDEQSFDESVVDQVAKHYNLNYKMNLVEPKNWNSDWESSFQPVVIDKFVAIRAEFHEPHPDVRYEIIITPKMSFGTVHHATTVLMIEQMCNLELAGKRVMDFGTGTGILAILAEKMGAEKIIGIDYDDWSIENAAENLERNKCSRIELLQSDTARSTGQYGIILANINKNVILENLTLLSQQLEKGGTLLLSGLLKDDEGELRDAAVGVHLKYRLTVEKNRWIAIRFTR